MLSQIKTGWLLNLVGVFVIMLGTHTYGGFIFNFDQYPLWAESLNTSRAGNTTKSKDKFKLNRS